MKNYIKGLCAVHDVENCLIVNKTDKPLCVGFIKNTLIFKYPQVTVVMGIKKEAMNQLIKAFEKEGT